MIRAFFTALFLFSVALASSLAHPHMWIDGTVELDFNAVGVANIRVRWRFDEFNSADMIMSFDTDRDGTLTSVEVEQIRDQAFAHLKDVDYFTVVQRAGSGLPIPEATSFDALIDDGALIYLFSLPIRIPWAHLNDVVFAFFDTGYFVDFLPEIADEQYSVHGRVVNLRRETVRYETAGYGFVRVPAIRMVAR